MNGREFKSLFLLKEHYMSLLCSNIEDTDLAMKVSQMEQQIV